MTLWITRTLIILGSGYLIVAELPTSFELGVGFSFNLVVTVITWALATALCALQRAWFAFAVSITIILFVVLSGMNAGNDAYNFQYSIPFAIFFAVASISMNHGTVPVAQHSLLVAAFLVLPTWVIVSMWVNGAPGIPRSSAPVVPLAVVVLLYFAKASNLTLRILSALSALGLLVILAVTTARMAFALTFMVIILWSLVSSGWSLLMKIGFSSTLTVLSALYWLGGSWQRERIFGRDASIEIGPIALNGEGRAAGSQIALGSDVDRSIFTLLWGDGGGSSGQLLLDAGFHLDKPHNEFIRVFVDGGLILATVLLAAIALPALAGVLNFRRCHERDLLMVPILVSLIILGFSLSDNALSYIWLLLPAALLVSWSRAASSVPVLIPSRGLVVSKSVYLKTRLPPL